MIGTTIRESQEAKDRACSYDQPCTPPPETENKSAGSEGSGCCQMTKPLRCYFCLATKGSRSNCARLLNHRIRLDQHVLRYGDANFTRSLQVDENFEF